AGSSLGSNRLTTRATAQTILRAMDRVVVRGSAPLEGSVRIEGAKNSALKLMAASLMAPGRFVLRNVPHIVDVEIMSDLLLSVGADVRRTEDHVLVIDVGDELTPEAP